MIVRFVLMSALILGLPFLTTQAADKAQWKTFKNSYGGFSIELPKTWEVIADWPDGDAPIPERTLPIRIEGPKEMSDRDERHVRIRIEVREPNEIKGRSPKDFAKLSISAETESIDEGAVRLGGEQGYQVTVYDSRRGVPATVFRCIDVPHKKRQFEVCISEVGKGATDGVHTAKDWKYGADIDRVIGSFKFIK